MIKILSKDQDSRVGKDLSEIYESENSYELPNSMNYKGLINLLKEYGIGNVSNYFESRCGLYQESFSILSDLPTILSYWILKYGDEDKVNIFDLLRSINEEYYATFWGNDGDPVDICARLENDINRNDYRSLKNDEKIRLRKEVEDSLNILATKEYIFTSKINK